MTTIVFKSTCGMDFNLSNGHKVIVQGQGILNIIKDDDFELLMKEYGSFIKPRILTDRNPSGCFIIATSMDYAKDMSKEVGDVKDASAQIEIKEEKKEIESIKIASGDKAEVKNEDGLSNLMDLEKAVIEATKSDSKKANKTTKKKK